MAASGSGHWRVFGAVGLAMLMGLGLFSAHPGGGALPPPVSVGTPGGPIGPPSPDPAPVNESTLVLSNDTLVPGDFVAESSDLPSLETYDPITNEVFVESFYADVIDVVSGSSDRVVAAIPTGAYPNTLAYDAQNDNVYFGLQTYDEVSVVNASTDLIQRTVGIGVEPLAMAADPVNGDLFVTGTNATGAAFVVVLNGSSGVVQDTFSLGADRFPVAGPNGIAYDPGNGKFYVPSVPAGTPAPEHGNLTILSASEEKVLSNVALAFDPSSILFAPAQHDLYLGNESGSDLVVFDPATKAVVGTVTLPDLPTMLAYDSTDGDLFAGLAGNVSVVSTSTNTVVHTFPVLRNPDGLAYDPVNGYVYVSDYVGNNVSVVNASSYRVVTSALLGSAPYNIAFDAANGDLYVGDLLSSQLIVVNGTSNRVVGYVPLGATPYGVVYDPRTTDIYVDDYSLGNVAIVNGTRDRVVGHLPAGIDPWGIAYDGANHDLYVTNPGSDNITVLNPGARKVVTTLDLSTPPGAIAYDPKSATMFVGEYDTGNVSVLNARTNALVRNSTSGSEVYTISVDPVSGRVFVGNYGSDNVTVLGPRGQELGLSVAAGAGVFGSAYDPYDGDVYVASFDSELVTVINGTRATGIGGYATATGPVAVAVDPVSGTVYVADYDSDSLTLLSSTFRVATFNVTFRATGLPAGTTWWMRFDGVGESGSGSTLGYFEPNGTDQPYAIGTVAGYTVAREFGTVHVNGQAIVVTVRFVPDKAARIYGGRDIVPTSQASGLVGWSITFAAQPAR